MKITDAEWTVMQVVWRDAPVTAREVLARVEDRTDWAYTTVKTILGRLVAKGALREAKRGNASVYEPAVTRRQARRTALRSLLDKAFDGTFGSLVQHLVADENLSKTERAKLARMLAELDPDGGSEA